MDLKYCDRSTYRAVKKGGKVFEDWIGNNEAYVVPEGGSNKLAVKGCMEILDERCLIYDVLCCPVGTGATLSGLILASKNNQNVIGFSALKAGGFLKNEVKEFLNLFNASKNNWSINVDSFRGGYAKVDMPLFDFVQSFKRMQGIQLDYIYNGKMMMALIKMIESGIFNAGIKILAIHTGGIQGNEGIEMKMKHRSS